MQKEDIKKIEKEINYKFVNSELLVVALTHSSYANENDIKSYERLEFLGDSILNFAVSEFLFTHYTNLNEGRLSKIRAYIVNQDAVFNAVKDFEFVNHIKAVEGLEIGKPIISDVCEAIVGAVFLDSNNYDVAKNVVLELLKNSLKTDFNKKIITDYKSYLLEKCQASKQTVQFSHYKQSEQIEPCFKAELYINNKLVSTGYGRTKKRAEQMASKEAINKIENLN